MHTPVLLQKAIEKIEVKPGGKYIDATAGEGGHIVSLLEKGANVLGLDADQEQIDNLEKIIAPKKQLTLIKANFCEIEEVAKKFHFFPVDGILFDLGLSMRQLNQSKKGFSYKFLNDPLDMRLDEKKQSVTAADLVNSLDENSIYEIFARNSEEIYSRPIAHALISGRVKKEVKCVGDLISIIDIATKGSGSRSYARIFQALRIEVNKEFENLKKALIGSKNILSENGKIVIITFHSVEDRIVKNFMRTHRAVETYKKIGGEKKFERSAKLRVITFQHQEKL